MAQLDKDLNIWDENPEDFSENRYIMNLCDIDVIHTVLRQGFSFSKAKGQNFLTAPWVPKAIAEQAGVDETAGVLEVGPGIGALTQELCLRAGKVCAVEVDKRLIPILSTTVGHFPALELVCGDILDMDIPGLVAQKFQGLRPMACANLPYYITTPILTALLEAECFDSVTVMVQREVAQRIAAQPGTGEYGAFSIFCQYYAQPELLFDVPASCFVPQPKVTSAVVRLAVQQQRPWDIQSPEIFFRAVRSSFAMRRKKLSNGLAAGFPELGKTGVEDVIAACGFPASVRGETLGIPEFAALANELARRTQGGTL